MLYYPRNSHIRGENLFLLSCVALVFLAAPSLLFSQDIKEIKIEGNQRVSAERILQTSQLHTGEPYSVMKIQRGIKKLFATGLFEDVQVLGGDLDDGIMLFVRVTENPTVRNVNIAGVEALKKKDVMEAVTIKRGSLLDASQLVESRNKVLSLYREEGYHLASINIEIVQTGDPGLVDLDIEIEEGKKVEVEKIEFEGNHFFSDDKLRSRMKTEEDGFWPWQGTHFKEKVLEEDLGQKIGPFYQDRGYIDFVVENHETRFDLEDGKAYITIWVDEGERYKVGDIEYVGNEFFSKRVLESAMQIEAGKFFSQKNYDKSIAALYELYGNQGYLYSEIVPRIRKEGNTANVTFYIRENDPAYVRRIIVEGNEVTHEKIIRRELEILPGDRFKQQLLVRSYQGLMNTGYFENVDVHRKPIPGENDDVDLVFDVAEKRTGQASTGAGFGAGGGLTGFLELSQTNLFGRGQSGRIRLEHGSRQTNFQLSFTEPYFRDSQTSIGIDLFHIDQGFVNDPFRRKSTGGSLRFGLPVKGMPSTRFYTSYRLERFDLRAQGNSVDQSDPVFEGYPRLLSAVTLNVVRDTRDNNFHPSTGTRHSLSAEYAGGIFGGSTDFQKYRMNSAWSMPGFWKLNLTLKAKAGLVTGYGNAGSIPLNERFILGGIGPGIEGLRGYADRSVGPIAGSGIRRGNSFLLLTAEEELMITRQIYAVLFFDAGNAWSSFSAADPANLKKSAGFGVRIEIPGMGPLGLDIGYGFDRPDGGGFEPHVTFGNFF